MYGGWYLRVAVVVLVLCVGASARVAYEKVGGSESGIKPAAACPRTAPLSKVCLPLRHGRDRHRYTQGEAQAVYD